MRHHWFLWSEPCGIVYIKMQSCMVTVTSAVNTSLWIFTVLSNEHVFLWPFLFSRIMFRRLSACWHLFSEWCVLCYGQAPGLCQSFFCANNILIFRKLWLRKCLATHSIPYWIFSFTHIYKTWIIHPQLDYASSTKNENDEYATLLSLLYQSTYSVDEMATCSLSDLFQLMCRNSPKDCDIYDCPCLIISILNNRPEWS